MHTYIRIYMHIHIHTYMRIYRFGNASKLPHTYINAHMHTYTHAYIQYGECFKAATYYQVKACVHTHIHNTHVHTYNIYTCIHTAQGTLQSCNVKAHMYKHAYIYTCMHTVWGMLQSCNILSSQGMCA